MKNDSAGSSVRRAFFELAPAAMLCTDNENRIVDANGAWERLTGFTLDEAIGRPVGELLVADGGGPELARHFSELRAGGQVRERALELVRRDGTLLEVEMDGERAEDPEGGSVGLWVLRDVTGRNQTRRALSEREEQLERLIELSPDMILLHRDGLIVYSNGAATGLLGAGTPEDLLGRAVPEALLGEDRAPLFEARVTGGDRERLVEVARIEVQFEGLPAELIIGRDLTERRSLQNRLAQADRLATVGTLAAGVAHEINNPLTYVLHYVERLRNQLRLAVEEGEPLHVEQLQLLESGAATAFEGCERVRDIVRDLKTFGRVDDGPRSPIDVNRAVRAAIQMLSHQVPFGVEISVALGPATSVRAHEGRLCQVFVNLLVNASQSIGKGRGRVTVRSWAEGPRVFVTVSDTGSGIEADHLGRLFEPFFSTKSESVGTGLGLWICRDIVHDMRGHIEVESEVGRGSTFTVVLPASDAHSEITTDPPSGAYQIPDTSVAARRILVVDDEPALRALLSEALSERGQVLTAASGREARELIEVDEAFDVILCDLMMPEMNGVELYAWVREQHPELVTRIVFMTGAAYTPRAREFLAHVRNERLDKPFRVRDLEGVLDRMLGPHLSA